MNDWFYPQRQRCLGCRKYFGSIIVKRLYCSYRCAGMEPPHADPAQRPRGCRTRTGDAKKVYLCPEEVIESGQCGKNDTLHVYACDHCGMYHIGHISFNVLNGEGGETHAKDKGTTPGQHNDRLGGRGGKSQRRGARPRTRSS